MADYEVIASGSVDASAPTTINITGIPGTFKHLMLSLSAASTLSSGAATGTDYVGMRLNGDTASNYGYAAQIKGDSASGAGTQVRAAFPGQQALGWLYIPARHSGQSTKKFSHTNYYIPLYSGSTFKKAVLTDHVLPFMYDFPSKGNANGIQMWEGVSGWNNTAAITSIQLISYEAVISGTSCGFAVNTSYVLSGLA